MKRLTEFILIAMVIFTIPAAAPAETAQHCPYTDMWWGATADQVLALEGEEPVQTYPSIYMGITYVYPKKYMDASGQIKYMFNENKELMGLAWMYASQDTQAVISVYNDIYTRLEKELGTSNVASTNNTNAGGVWYTEHSDVLINLVSMEGTTALQCTYINPVASQRP